jgi:hypothetical protein
MWYLLAVYANQDFKESTKCHTCTLGSLLRCSEEEVSRKTRTQGGQPALQILHVNLVLAVSIDSLITTYVMIILIF